MSVEEILLVVVSALFAVSGNLMMKWGIPSAGGVSLRIPDVWSELTNLTEQPAFDLGLLLYLTATLLWFRVISQEKLSLSYPILVSLSLVFVTLGAVLISGEGIAPRQVLGISAMPIGVLLVSVSGSRERHTSAT